MNNMSKTIPATSGKAKLFRVRYNSPKMRNGSAEILVTASSAAEAKSKTVADLSKDHPNVRVMVVGER